MRYDYSFSIWPSEQSHRKGVYDLFRAGLQTRVEMEFSEAEWNVFRDDVEASGLTFREVERRPCTTLEMVSI